MSEARTGIENYLHHLLPGLVREWREGGGEVLVFAAHDGAVSHVQPPVRVVAGGGRGWTQARLPGAARRAGIDVYFSPIPILPLGPPMPCPCVITVHDLLEFRARWWYFGRLVGRSLGRAKAAICVSQATQAEVAAAFPDSARRTVVVREAADPTVFHPPVADDAAGHELLRRFGVERPPILAVGTIQPRKNYLRLIHAYALATEGQADPTPLLIVGKQGWDFDDVLALPARLGIERRVVFAGQLSDVDLGVLMRASLFLAAVSVAEGFGLPVVEAMFSGLPVLAADIPPFREVAGNGALFVNPLSTDDIRAGIDRLARDSRLRQELVEVGQNRRALFSWERASADVCSTLKAALTGI